MLLAERDLPNVSEIDKYVLDLILRRCVFWYGRLAA